MSDLSLQDLSRFQKPATLYAKVTPESLKIPNDLFFTSSDRRYQMYREAWAASLFARGFSDLVKQCEVRLLINDRFPDFEILLEGHIYPFEFAEAQEEERRRGKEYTTGHKPSVKWADIELAAQWICQAVKKKAHKCYKPEPNLLIYVNFKIAKSIDLKLVRKLCTPHRSAFKSIWLLFAVSIAQVFSGKDFDQACREWSKIPGYLEESKKRMGI